VTEVGRVNRISVAVLVDGSYTKNEKGEMVYQDAAKQLDPASTWCARQSASTRSAATRSRS
jgi:flagellar M-ring protein FliF